MWCPGIAAITTQLIFNHSLRGMGWRPGRGRYLLAAYFLPLLYVFVTYAVIWLIGFGKFNPAALYQLVSESHIPSFGSLGEVGSYVVIMLTIGFVINCVAALGEEIGWRGLLVPELARTVSFTRTALISGGIWAIWHWPLVLSGQYNSVGTPLWFGLICFTILVISSSFVFTWFRLKSESLWATVLLHAAHNLFIQTFFNNLTSNTGITPYVIDEFGIGLALMASVLAYLFWRKRKEIEIVNPEILRSRGPEFAPAK